MNWMEQKTIIDLLISGVLVGIIVSAPLGPVGILCIQRTLNKGRWVGFITGIGAAMSDIIYAIITGYGMSFMNDFILKHEVLLQIVGSILLLLFGIYTYRTDPLKSMHKRSGTTNSYFQNLVTAFFVTLSNPLIIALFIALFARFSFVVPENNIGLQVAGYMAIAAGALLWWFTLTYFINKVRRRFKMKGIRRINRTIGVGVIVASIVGIVLAISGNSLY